MSNIPTDRPYELRITDTFRVDSRLIHSEWQTFRRMLRVARFILERAPFVDARCVDEGERIWTRVFGAHRTTDGIDVPELLVSYQIARHPPHGLIDLRHVRSTEDIASGLHVGDEPF